MGGSMKRGSRCSLQLRQGGMQALSEQGAARQQAVDAKQKEVEAQQAAAKAAQDNLQQQIAELTEQCNR